MGQHVGAQGAAPLHFFASTLWLLAGCSAVADPTPPPPGRQLFTLLPSSHTGVRFANRLTDTHDLNVFRYRNYYNGGGSRSATSPATACPRSCSPPVSAAPGCT